MIRNRAESNSPLTAPNRNGNVIAAIYSGLIHRVQADARIVAGQENESISVGLVGCHGKAGVSTVGVNFGLSCSYDLEQDVLLISANPGDNDLYRQLGIKRPKFGLNDLVDESTSFEEAVVKSEKGNISLLGSGLSNRETFSPFTVSRFGSIIEKAKENYRVVIVDMPPPQKASLTGALANKLDAVLMVIESSRTTTSEAKLAKRALERSGAQLVGSILNRQVDR